jgi:hypothetical protein
MLEQLPTRDDEVRVFKNAQGQYFVGVTSAMKLVKFLLKEPPDSYGPPALSRMHCAEGVGCHAVCLDYLAFQQGWLGSFIPPIRVASVHPDEARWRNVLALALAGFEEFCKGYKVEPIAVEQEACSASYGLVGHVDLVCTLMWHGRRMKAIVDLKFVTALTYTHELQVRCYGKLSGMSDAQLGLLFHCDRNTGFWTVKPVDLTIGQDDVIAVSSAARLYSWAAQKGRG